MAVALKCTALGHRLIKYWCKEIIFPTTLEVLKNVPVNTRRPSIMELVSCGGWTVAGLWTGHGPWLRGGRRHSGNEPENIISAATSSSPAASHKCYLINSKHLLWPRIFSQYPIVPQTNFREDWSFTIMEKTPTRTFSWLKVRKCPFVLLHLRWAGWLALKVGTFLKIGNVSGEFIFHLQIPTL